MKLCGPLRCVNRGASGHSPHLGPCSCRAEESSQIHFADFAEATSEQQANFIFDSAMRKQMLKPEGIDGVITLALMKTLPRPATALIGEFSAACCVMDFIEVANAARVRGNVRQKLDNCSTAVVPTAQQRPFLVKNMKTYRNLFFAFAGPVAKAKLPAGVYFTGSLCVAAALIPPTEASFLEEVVESLDNGRTYDSFVTQLNTRMGFPNTQVGIEDSAAAVTLNHLEEEDGLGPYARADVDIVVVAASNQEAEDKVKQTLGAVLECVGPDHFVVETPNSITVIPPFPQKHVQIITLWNKTEVEYLAFVDLDCTSLLYDGKESLVGSRRSLLAFTTGLNCVPAEMLSVRVDTPNRIGKYCVRGFGSFVFGVNSQFHREKLERARHAAQEKRPGYFLDMAFDDLDSDYAERLLVHTTHSQILAYSDTRLPRGYSITPLVIEIFLEKFWSAAVLRGRELLTRKFAGRPRVVRKLKVKKECWWNWGML